MEYQGKSEEKWIKHYTELNIDDVIDVLVKRVFPKAVFVFKLNQMSYANLVMENKPPIIVFAEDLKLYKSEKIAEIEAIFKDLKLEEEIKEGIKKLKHAEVAASMAAGEPNGTLVLDKVVKSKNKALLKIIETRDAEIEADAQKQDAKRKKLKKIKANLSEHLKILKEKPSQEAAIIAIIDMLTLMEEG